MNRIDGGNYQTIINQALHEYIQNDQKPLENTLSIEEKTLRRIIREELQVIGL